MSIRMHFFVSCKREFVHMEKTHIEIEDASACKGSALDCSQ